MGIVASFHVSIQSLFLLPTLLNIVIQPPFRFSYISTALSPDRRPDVGSALSLDGWRPFAADQRQCQGQGGGGAALREPLRADAPRPAGDPYWALVT